jgi:hypothetical protein
MIPFLAEGFDGQAKENVKKHTAGMNSNYLNINLNAVKNNA